MTLHSLPEPARRPVDIEARLTGIEAQIDVLIDGVKALLSEVVAIRERMDGDR